MTDPRNAVTAPPQAQRTFEGKRIWQLAPEALSRAIQLIAAAESAHRPDLIIGIARGGVTAARRLADAMQIPYMIINARHNADDRLEVPASGNVVLDSEPDLPDITGKRILVADDICGTGATLDAVRAVLEERGPAATVRCAVLCRNIGSPQQPDVWVWDVADWTVFPWETTPDRPTELLPLPAAVRQP
ncbi:phosphoribosyltransferase domain-containing protein [Actinoplanes sp. NPDC051411]|uniref:phosphoribosyltransferase n=1 Tax=Actinoplanes sp. NPDC051411 TaxID=3155522 RepID=UPI003432024D